jgi:hypothetical protein
MIDNIPIKADCIAIAEAFIREAQLNRYFVNYSCSEHPAASIFSAKAPAA